MLKGIDVSHHNGLAQGLEDLDFALVRATNGTRPDEMYGYHVENFRTGGVITGAYHFGNGRSSGATQAAAFLSAARDTKWLALDVEVDPGGSNMTWAQAREFIETVQAKGLRVGLYHSRSGFPNFGQNWNWVAQWGTRRPRFIKWAIWQWRGTPLDRDYFNGDLLALKRLAGLVPPPIPTRVFVALKKYIRNLSAVKKPTIAQIKKLALYKARLVSYLRRNAGK